MPFVKKRAFELERPPRRRSDKGSNQNSVPKVGYRKYLDKVHTMSLHGTNGLGSAMKEGLSHRWLICTLDTTYWGKHGEID